MFSYVAKSFLSKTLKTFLRKYLENIEFESLSYGSNATNTDAAASSTNNGWGVRLSNVKLREGMELIKLPGRRKRKVVVKKKVKRRKKKKCNEQKKSDVSSSDQKQQQMGGVKERVRKSSSHGNNAVPGFAKPNYGRNQHLESNTLNCKSDHPQRSMSGGFEFDYFSSAPTTPVKQRNITCTPLGLCSSSKGNQNVQFDNPPDLTHVPALPFHDLSDGPNVHDDSYENETKNMVDGSENVNMGPSTQLAQDSIFRNNFEPDYTDADSDRDSSDDSVVEVEEEQIIEDTLSLVVGKGGAIGTLNIRFVGKELHVTIEDAHLIIEALPTNDHEMNDNLDESNAETKRQLKSDSSPNETNIDLTADASGAASKANSSIGENIKKRNVLARYLSMIPHLFLRDCRISLILPGESEFAAADETISSYSISDCTVLECGIDFFSVTSGDDFIDVLRLDTGNAKNLSVPHSPLLPTTSNTTTCQSHNRNNVFSRKRIRTGKGPEGGIWLKIHPPNDAQLRSSLKINSHQNLWAREKFLHSSANFFFRCSGLDLHARMLVEVKDGMEDEMAAAWSSEYDDYTMDSMLFGVDYVDPISLTRHQIRETMKRERLDDPDKYNATTKVGSDTDNNGIQHISHPSNFYWLSQKTHRIGCPTDHIPLHECKYCWNVCISTDSRKQKSIMDKEMPLPGFVFCISVTDPIEMNVDRMNLEAVGYVISLFSGNNNELSGDKKKTHGKQAPMSTQSVLNVVHEKEDSNSSDDSFPKSMMPDAIFLSGIHLSKVILRVHAIQQYPQNDMGLQFRYWQLMSKALYLEEQHMNSDGLSIRDITFHVGHIEGTDFTGASEKQLLIAGSKGTVYLPFTASKVLDVSSPTSIDTCAIHTRIILCNTKQADDVQTGSSISSTGFFDSKVGFVNIDIDRSLIDEIYASAREAMLIVFPQPTEKKQKIKTRLPAKKSPNAQHSGMFQVSTRGGRVMCSPMIDLNIPETNITGRIGHDGLSFDTFLEGLGVKYGFHKEPPSKHFPLCSLPDTLRMHILVFLDDLSPLERVLQLDKKKNTSIFLRSHAINKKLSCTKNQILEDIQKSNDNDTDRRKKLIEQLQRLDDDTLEKLLATQCRSQITN